MNLNISLIAKSDDEIAAIEADRTKKGRGATAPWSKVIASLVAMANGANCAVSAQWNEVSDDVTAYVNALESVKDGTKTPRNAVVESLTRTAKDDKSAAGFAFHKVASDDDKFAIVYRVPTPPTPTVESKVEKTESK